MIYFDITTAVFCPPPAIGIPRVEVNVAYELLKLASEQIKFCIYEQNINCYSEIEQEAVVKIKNQHDGVGANDGNYRVQRKVANNGQVSDVFSTGDTVITIGFNWRTNLGNLAKIFELRKSIGIKVMCFCYDMIPLKFTHWVPGMEAVYEPHIRSIAQNADHVFCISHSTMRDLFEWTQEQAIRTPPMSVVPFGASIKVNADTPPSDRIAEIIKIPFLLTVCTIETRKSHETIIRAYTRLVDRMVKDLPKLLFIGGVGQGGKELLDSVAADERIKDSVIVMSGINDADLSLLYQHCLFTLYPSLYEGWGLPISESLAHGKFCIAGTGSSLPEAGGAFIEYADPWDVEKWCRLIEIYCGNQKSLQRKEAFIKSFYLPTIWGKTAESMYRFLISGEVV